MSYAYFGYINGTYSDISGVVSSWSTISEKLLVYQHGPDDGSSKDHCHLLVIGITIAKKHLYKRKEWKSLKLDGTKKEFGFDDYETGRETIGYMSKGIYDPVFNKGFTEEEIAEGKSKGYVKAAKGEGANANAVSKKKKTAKDTHFDICMRVRDMSLKRNALMRNADGEIVNAAVFASFDNVYKNLLTVLDEEKIRTSEYDMDRWLFTILRNDPYSDGIRDKFREKYKSRFYEEAVDILGPSVMKNVYT